MKTGVTSVAAPDGTPFDVPSDLKASYALLKVEKGKGGNIVATTRRSGPSGVSFARRENDCSAQTFRYVGEGDTLEEAQQPAPNPGKMSTLVDGSITDVTVKSFVLNDELGEHPIQQRHQNAVPPQII